MRRTSIPTGALVRRLKRSALAVVEGTASSFHRAVLHLQKRADESSLDHGFDAQASLELDQCIKKIEILEE